MRFLILMAVVSLIVSCGKRNEGKPYDRQEYPLNGIKYIQAGKENRNDSSDFLQEEYLLDKDKRLLMRLENLLEHSPNIVATQRNQVLLVLTFRQPFSLTNQVKLCPLKKNWMMLATWNYAHPFGSGKWETPGGDFDLKECLAPSPGSKENTMSFDLTDWFVSSVRGRVENYGFALISDAPIKIYGEKSTLFSPRLIFDKE